jgi:hypothetical protein
MASGGGLSGRNRFFFQGGVAGNFAAGELFFCSAKKLERESNALRACNASAGMIAIM